MTAAFGRQYLRDLDDQADLDRIRFQEDAKRWQRLSEEDRVGIESAVEADFARRSWLPKVGSYQRGGAVFTGECYRRMRLLLAERANQEGEDCECVS